MAAIMSQPQCVKDIIKVLPFPLVVVVDNIWEEPVGRNLCRPARWPLWPWPWSGSGGSRAEQAWCLCDWRHQLIVSLRCQDGELTRWCLIEVSLEKKYSDRLMQKGCTGRYIKSVTVLLTHCSVLAYSYRFYVLSLQHGSLYMTNWWSVSIGSDNGLVHEGTKPFPKPMLTKINDAIFLPAWAKCLPFSKHNFDH